MSSQSSLSENSNVLDEEPFLPVSNIYSKSFKKKQNLAARPTCHRLSLLYILNVAILCLSIILFTATSVLYRKSGCANERNSFLKATSQPSPLFTQLDISFITKRMNGTLLETEPKNIFRQPPSPEVDAAWDRLQTRDPIAITREDVILMGKDPSDTAKFPLEFGFGPDAYIAKIDVFHQIHCLNQIRKNMRSNFSYYFGAEFPGDTPTDKSHDLHVSHCVNSLLENLTCYGNVDVYTHFWNDAQIHPFPDFNIEHKCRNFDAILAWQEENAVSLDDMEWIRAPEDANVHVMSKEFKEAMHWHDDEVIHDEVGHTGTG